MSILIQIRKKKTLTTAITIRSFLRGITTLTPSLVASSILSEWAYARLLLTQLYFAGELENERDIFLSNIERKECVVVEFQPRSSGEKLGTFGLNLA